MNKETIKFHGADYDASVAYRIVVEHHNEGDILHVGFGAPAQNDTIVRDAVARINEMVEKRQLSGPLLKINGAASLPVAVAIAHAVLHLYETVAIYDPKLPDPKKYVVAVSHGPAYQAGDLIE